MKKILSTVTLSAFLLIPVQSAFAWSYDGPNSLNPFTGFRNCNKCEKVKKQKCHRPKKCNRCAKIRTMSRKYSKAFN